jgi:GNAT superfamily N-acetyltransferase
MTSADRALCSPMRVTIVSGKQWPDATARLLRDLPEWFGIEESVLNYIDAARTLPTTAARRNDEVVGVCLVRRHTPVAAEIELLAVQRAVHRHGIGRQLVHAVEDGLREVGVQLLQVKTLGPSAASEEYERTRAFYESIGFMPLEERSDIWDAENPCLISVKPLV